MTELTQTTAFVAVGHFARNRVPGPTTTGTVQLTVPVAAPCVPDVATITQNSLNSIDGSYVCAFQINDGPVQSVQLGSASSTVMMQELIGAINAYAATLPAVNPTNVAPFSFIQDYTGEYNNNGSFCFTYGSVSGSSDMALQGQPRPNATLLVLKNSVANSLQFVLTQSPPSGFADFVSQILGVEYNLHSCGIYLQQYV